MKSGFRVVTASLLILACLATQTSTASTANEDWKTILEEGNQFFTSGDFARAAEKYNASGQLALDAGEQLEAAKIFAKLGRCFITDRLDKPDLFIRYLGEAAELIGQIAADEEDHEKAGNLYLDSASYASEAGLTDQYLMYVNSSAFTFLKVAEEEDFASASSHLLKAGYLFQFNNLSEHLGLAASRYRTLVLDEADRIIAESENASSGQRWDEAGKKYFDAAVGLQGLQDPFASDVFGLAANALLKAADSMVIMEEADPRNISHRADLYNLAGIASELNSLDGSEQFHKAGDDYSQAGEILLESEESVLLICTRGNISAAAQAYEKAGLAELSKEKYKMLAEITQTLVSSPYATRHLYELETAKAYDSAGLYREAGEAYLRALDAFPVDTGTITYPWQYLELFEILGKGRRPKQARFLAEFLDLQGLGYLSFFGGPSFGGYDLMFDLGPDIARISSDNYLHRAYVTETLLMAAASLMNHLPEMAKSLLEKVSGQALLMDPANKAFHDLLVKVSESQLDGHINPGLTRSRAVVKDLYFNDLCFALDDLLPSGVFLPRCQSMFRTILGDLDQAASYNQTINTYYLQVQEILDQLSESRMRDVEKHRKIANLLEIQAKRWISQGNLNGSSSAGSSYMLASYHACAGDEYQRAILFHDLSAGCFEARTPLTAAAFAVANSMMEENQTLKDEARKNITVDLSVYLDPENVAVLISVLEGRTDLGGTSSIFSTIAMALIGGFVLLTSYVILIWEPKHPLRGGKSVGEPSPSPDSVVDRKSIKPTEPNEADSILDGDEKESEAEENSPLKVGSSEIEDSID